MNLGHLSHLGPSIEVRSDPKLEGKNPRWRWIDERTVLVAPSLYEELKKRIVDAESIASVDARPSTS